METDHFVLPEHLREFVQCRVNEGGYSNTSEYIEELIRADQHLRERLHLEDEVLRGLRSGESVELTREEWDEIRETVRARHLGSPNG